MGILVSTTQKALTQRETKPPEAVWDLPELVYTPLTRGHIQIRTTSNLYESLARLRIPHNTIIKLTPYVPHIIPFGHSAVSHALFIPHGFKDYCDSKPLLALSDIAAITARCASLYLEPTSPARLHEGLVAAARAQLLLDANVTPKSEDDPYFDYIQSLIGKSKRGLAPYQRLLESLRNVRFSESHSTYFSN